MQCALGVALQPGARELAAHLAVEQRGLGADALDQLGQRERSRRVYTSQISSPAVSSFNSLEVSDVNASQSVVASSCSVCNLEVDEDEFP